MVIDEYCTSVSADADVNPYAPPTHARGTCNSERWNCRTWADAVHEVSRLSRPSSTWGHPAMPKNFCRRRHSFAYVIQRHFVVVEGPPSHTI